MKIRKRLCLLLVGLMFVVMLAGCSNKTGTEATTAAATTAAATTAAATTAAATTSAATTTAAPPSTERPVLTMSTTDAGINAPAGTDFSDNPFVNVIENYAGVDLEIDVIPWADYQTKANLLLASGKYPDILHTAYNENIEDVESRGAFINLLPYFESSSTVQKYVDHDSYIEKMADPVTHEYYAIPMGTTGDGYPDGYWLRARYDLLEKYNNGEWPKDLEGWVDVARKLKADNPNATPFSAWCPGTMIFQYNKQFWYAYGVESNLDFVLQDDGTYIFNVEKPEYKEAMEFHRKLYEEGLLSQTFATNTDYAMFTADADNNDLLVVSDSVQQMDWFMTQNTGEIVPVGAKWICAPLLETYPVDREDAMWWNTKFSAFDNGHRVHISAKTQYPDEAWKVIEGLCCDELYELVFWGEEGVTYNVVDGERVVVPEAYSDENRTYGQIYGMIMGYAQGRLASLSSGKLALANEPDRIASDGNAPG